MKQILIGVQARSTSTRLPGKSSFILGNNTVVEHVLQKCVRASNWLLKQSGMEITSDVFLLVPEGDPLRKLQGPFEILEGSEPDVLSRYVQAATQTYPDYICRITGDCPLIPEFVISTIIKMAVKGGNDYTSNIIPAFRTAIDGHDCEVLSNRALQWLDNSAVTVADREHVTSKIVHEPPTWARIHPVIGYCDLSYVNLSVDTQADMDAVRSQHESVNNKVSLARKMGYKVGRL